MYIALCAKIDGLTDELACSRNQNKELDKKLEDCEKENTALEDRRTTSRNRQSKAKYVIEMIRNEYS